MAKDASCPWQFERICELHLTATMQGAVIVNLYVHTTTSSFQCIFCEWENEMCSSPSPARRHESQVVLPPIMVTPPNAEVS